MTIRIAVRGKHEADQQGIMRNVQALGIQGLTASRITRIYFLAQDLGTESIQRLCAFLLVDPVTETASWSTLDEPAAEPTDAAHVIEVALRPGVTDVTARELARGMEELGLPTCDVATATRYELHGDLTAADLHLIARKLLCNETIEHYSLAPITPQFGIAAEAHGYVESIPLLDLDEDALATLSRERVLSLDRTEMRVIRDFFRSMEREPTDVELETLAQTWSEHCVHKTFRARIDFTWRDADGTVRHAETVDGLFTQYIRAATEAIQPTWVRSVFVDDAGIIAFDDEFDLAFKVETHNHPSALEPFGGANTGVGGVVRDIIGVSARPIACTDVLCFGPQDLPHDQLPDGVLHPRRIADGVVAGIADYGNKLGLPTVNGAVIYDAGYLGNPLVFCGCVGLLPCNSHPTEPQSGDRIVVIGGRTGRDGIHGATFSSAELTHQTAETVGSAVQIGDPITEKGVLELVEAARNAQLYHAITDCGAGGLSSAVGEMGEELGVDVELTHVPLKYPGLTPWEIWLSEAQERMVLAVPPQNLSRLRELADLWDVEISDLGEFTGDRHLRVRYDGAIVADMPMSFVHDGLPQRHMQAVWQDPAAPAASAPAVENLEETLLALLAHPSVASKESIIRRYDHEVRGGTLGRPLVGPQMDGPGDAAVLKPLGTWAHEKAFALSAGINPLLGKRDPYAMAVGAIDEAVRNAVAVGADPDRIAILDNFCWGNPTYPDRLGALVRTCQGCYDAAVAYKAPFISGKDSLYNEFNGQPIPGTLLISAIGIVPDMRRRVSADFKTPGNRIYLLGETRAELGGSLLHHHLDHAGGAAPAMPSNPLDRYRLLHRAMRRGLIAACHDLSEGGLAVALAEMALAGRLGAKVEIGGLEAEDRRLETGDGSSGSGQAELSPVEALFSESNGRLLVEVRPDAVEAVEALFADEVFIPVGEVTETPQLVVNGYGHALIDLSVDQLIDAWKR
jgi:phosphoribosylformylglycinamidine synthase